MDDAELKAFYEDCYAPDPDPAAADRYAGWRRLSAVAKADHVVALARKAGTGDRPRVLDVGCGDGALLQELAERGFGASRVGYELSSTAVAIAEGRPGIDRVAVFDGATLPEPDGSHDLAILSHVLEHVPDPAAVLREVARVARTIVAEVPLEANASARRPDKRRHAAEIGHLHQLDRAAVRAFAADAGLRVVAELSDPLGLEVHRYFATTPAARAKGTAKWAVRRALAAVPPIGERLITVHYAVALQPV